MDGAPFRPRRQLGELEGAGNGGVDQDVLAICGAAGLPFPEPIPLEEPETYSATASRSQSMFRSVTSVCRNGIAMPASLKASRMAIRRSVLVLPALLRS